VDGAVRAARRSTDFRLAGTTAAMVWPAGACGLTPLKARGRGSAGPMPRRASRGQLFGAWRSVSRAGSARELACGCDMRLPGKTHMLSTKDSALEVPRGEATQPPETPPP
jgi:hypothetical protein